jgi:glucose-6-phosphate dehydrogenase assembly protein OpcA
VTTLWDTTGSDVVKALSAERRSAGALAFGLALTLVVVTDQRSVEEAERAATAAAAAHPCRLLMVIRRHVDAPDPRLDAEVLIGGRLGPGEAVVMRMYGRLALHAESVTLPLLAPDAPVVTWWHDAPPDKIAFDPLGVFADRRITDVARTGDPLAALHQRAVDYAPGDTDLAWTRTTSWRSLIAAAFDSVSGKVTAASVTGPRIASWALLVGWLRSRLGVDAELREARGQEISEVSLTMEDGRNVLLRRNDSRTATLVLPDQGERLQPLTTRDVGDLLAEEVRRLDADEVYADALSAWTGVTGLSDRSPFRTHIWRDPQQEQRAEDGPPPTGDPGDQHVENG